MTTERRRAEPMDHDLRRSAGVVLAAGRGSRFGDSPKLLADLDGKPVLQHVVDAAVAALPRVVVVLGHRAAEIVKTVDLTKTQVVICEEWERGQSASLQAGIAAAGATKIVLLLGDQPLIDPSLVEQFSREPAGTRASWKGTPGHPAVLGEAEIAAAWKLEGDQGLKHMQWRLVERGPLRDIDTPDDLEAVRREARAIL